MHRIKLLNFGWDDDASKLEATQETHRPSNSDNIQTNCSSNVHTYTGYPSGGQVLTRGVENYEILKAYKPSLVLMQVIFHDRGHKDDGNHYIIFPFKNWQFSRPHWPSCSERTTNILHSVSKYSTRNGESLNGSIARTGRLVQSSAVQFRLRRCRNAD